MTPANKRQKPWMADVKYQAQIAMQGRPPISRPVILHLRFYFLRPKCHFGSGKNSGIVKASAPKDHTTKPDLTKLIRAVEDALTGVCWADDCKVIEQYTRKEYGETPGVFVQVM